MSVWIWIKACRAPQGQVVALVGRMHAGPLESLGVLLLLWKTILMLRQLNRLSRKHTVEASPPSREKKVYNIRARHKNKTLSVLLFKPCVFQRIKYRCFVSSFSISFRHRRYTHQALNLLQHKLSLAGQEGLQQPKRSVCLLGKLQVTLPCISADTRHQRMQWYQADQSQLL